MCAGGCAVGVDTRADALLVEPALLSFEVSFSSRFVLLLLASEHALLCRPAAAVGRRRHSGGRHAKLARRGRSRRACKACAIPNATRPTASGTSVKPPLTSGGPFGLPQTRAARGAPSLDARVVYIYAF